MLGRKPVTRIVCLWSLIGLGCHSVETTSRSEQPVAKDVASAKTNDGTDDPIENAPEVLAVGFEEPRALIIAEDGPANQTIEKAIRLSILDAAEMTLARNPDLVALRESEAVSVAMQGVAATYPFNPFVQVQATPQQTGPNGESGTVYHYVLIMQQIQLAHQQRFREAVADAQLYSVRWNVIQAELLAVAQTERLFFTAVYQRGLRDLAQINWENNQQLLTILERQLDAGQATAADVAMVRLDARSTKQQLQLAEATYQTALLDLRRQLGLDLNVAIELDETLDDTMESAKAEQGFTWQELSSEKSGVSALATARPDVRAARADIDAARAGVRLANASRVPDVQIGPYYQRTLDDATFLGFRAHMEVPVWNTGVPLMRQREAELRQRSVTYQQLQTRAELEAEMAINRYERARRLLSESEIVDSQEFPIELQRLEAQFKEGEVDVLRVFQARNSLIQNRRAFLDSLNELMQSAANVTASTGLPLETMLPAASKHDSD